MSWPQFSFILFLEELLVDPSKPSTGGRTGTKASQFNHEKQQGDWQPAKETAAVVFSHELKCVEQGVVDASTPPPSPIYAF
jgi:hypothetical protein